MRVAYIYFLMEDASFGVLQKTVQQARALERAKIPGLDILVFNPSKEEVMGNLHYIRFRGSGPRVLRAFRYLFDKRGLIDDAFDLSPYDVLIMRHSFSDSTLVKMAGQRTVIPELHSKIIEELEMKVAEGGNPVRTLIRRLRVRIEKRFLYRFIDSCAGYITNGEELSRHIAQNTGNRLPHVTVFNGCDVQSTPVTGFRPFNGHDLHIGFLGSRPDVWHGLDRLAAARETYRSNGGKVNVHLHFIGRIAPGDLGAEHAGPDLHFHGVLQGKELDRRMSTFNLAVCPLALHRKQLNETSAIKTVEYLARGIPFIIAYDDTALTGREELKGTYLQFPNDRSAIDMQDIITFSSEVSRKREDVIQQMRHYAETECDWSVKLREYVKFAQQAGQP